ncbi:MAG: Gfo/Idh/MocA family oxidoreductase [Bacillota bacterium]|nr:Gfo/Idh/MocA family oxidoreductase [Bacillota bacterium]HHU61189.1 Gfo/Idh/MocA family oxidoreductase [Natronincola sp.]
MGTTKIAFIGVGGISGIYLKNLTELFKQIEIIGVCDLIRERAEKAAEQYGIPKIYETMHDAFADPEVEIILNLTRPYEHFEVTKAALEAGKHVYSEKPLGATKEEGEKLIALAKEKGLSIGGAPDTFLGASIQTCRKLIEDGFIGDPVGFNAFMICRGHETWHHDPAFYYQFGGGPMMDMGPYYLTALVNLLGRVKAVTGVAKTSFAQRVITSSPLSGQVVDVEVPTYTTGILELENGVIGNLMTTFDVHYNKQASFEIYGSEGTLIVPDPNFFGEAIYMLRPETGEYKEVPLLFDYKENSRGVGLADMAIALKNNRPIRANMEQTFHVLDVMTAFERSSEKKAREEITSSFKRQAPMEKASVLGVLDS